MRSNKLREALSKASIALSWATHGHLTEDDAKECLEVVDAALAEPLRNYEVGTAEEQYERFLQFCDKKIHCEDCPLYERGGLVSMCLVRWLQMPYNKEEAK